MDLRKLLDNTLVKVVLTIILGLHAWGVSNPYFSPWGYAPYQTTLFEKIWIGIIIVFLLWLWIFKENKGSVE